MLTVAAVTIRPYLVKCQNEIGCPLRAAIPMITAVGARADRRGVAAQVGPQEAVLVASVPELSQAVVHAYPAPARRRHVGRHAMRRRWIDVVDSGGASSVGRADRI